MCSFDALRQKAQENKANKKDLRVCLIYDEVAIRSQSQYSIQKQKFMGHITAGKPDDSSDCSPLAKEALVFMVSGLTEEFRAPIAYFLIKGLCAEEKAALVSECMYMLHESGVILVSLTFDGVITNIRTVKILGAIFDDEKPFFMNPFDQNRVWVILDAPHMLKLLRNCLANRSILFKDEEEIKWQFVVDLISLQIGKDMNFGNKLTKTHLEFDSKKMNVRIAAQTLSESTASSMEFLALQKHVSFIGSEPTQEYIRIANNLFDIMNSKKNHGGKNFKRPFSESAEIEFDRYFEYARKYLKSLKVMENGVRISIFKSKSFTPFFGLFHNTFSFMGIYKDYLKNQNEAFFTFSVSQDHVESFFGCIRRMNGCNDNPNAQQFEAAYRKLLVKNEIESSVHSNCLNDITQILNVSSRPKPKNNQEEIAKQLEKLADIDFILRNDDDKENVPDYSTLEKHSIAYIATKVEARVISRAKCDLCINVFFENEHINDEFINFKAKKEQVHQPCKGTMQIIHSVDSLIKRHETQEVSLEAMVSYIYRNISMDMNIYTASDGHGHTEDLMKLIIRSYLDIKSTHVAKIVTRNSQKQLVRHIKLKEIHRAGQ